MEEKIKNILSNALLISGSPCSGKSSITEELAKRYDLTYFKIDDYEFEHLHQSNPEKHPTMYKLSQMKWNDIWMRPVDEQVTDEFQYYRERWDMILQELLNYEESDSIITEGAALLPELIDQLGIEKERVIYIVPSKEFQVQHYSKRDFIHGILAECDNPEQAFANWMERDHQFGKLVAKQAEALGMKVIYVDGVKTLEENIEIVRDHFELK